MLLLSLLLLLLLSLPLWGANIELAYPAGHTFLLSRPLLKSNEERKEGRLDKGNKRRTNALMQNVICHMLRQSSKGVCVSVCVFVCG